MGKCKVANILEMASLRAKWNEIWDSSPNMAILKNGPTWLMAKFHAQNMAILKIDPHLRNRCP